jgi:hypothetical protein
MAGSRQQRCRGCHVRDNVQRRQSIAESGGDHQGKFRGPIGYDMVVYFYYADGSWNNMIEKKAADTYV